MTSHEAWGLGIYSVFTNPNVFLTRAVEVPTTANVKFHHLTTVNLTNNGWFGEGSAQWQHAAGAVFRTVENGVLLIRCSNNGLTCWMDAHGRIMVLMTHNTDLGDSWEREGEDSAYFYQFSPPGYAVGLNVLVYVLTH